MNKVILHCDLNNFYASVECLYDPSLRNSPVAVCGKEDLRHGIVLAKNYNAKKYGVMTGEAIWKAKQKCPNLIIVPPNYSRYLKFSKEAREIYSRYTNLVEAFGIDECWIDVSESTRLFGSGKKIADEIRDTIKKELGITASIGVSYNKVFAKLGSDIRKPNYTTCITQKNFREKIWKLPASELLYVGRSTQKKLADVGISTIGEIASAPPFFLKSYLGKWGEMLWIFANGMDNSPVTAIDYSGVIKSIGNSMTTPRDLVCDHDVHMLIYVLSESVSERLRNHNLKARTIQIRIKDNKLFSFERQAKLFKPSYITSDIAKKSMDIFKENWDWKDKSIRSIGVRATDLVTADTCTQLSFFEADNRLIKKELLEKVIDHVRQRFGHYSVQRAVMLTDKGLNSNPVEENVIHPVSFFR